MFGRGRRETPRGHGLRWLAAGAGVVVAGAAVLAMTPAHASATTVDAQLTLTGVASATSPTGGSTVGVHPGDSVAFDASSLPTAGAPAGLGSLLNGVVSGLTGFEVVIDSGTLPGVKHPYRLGSCPGDHSSLKVAFPTKGTYKFTYRAYSVELPLLGCTRQIQLSGDQIKDLTDKKIAINASTTYGAQVVVATDPPKGGITIQLPTVQASPSVGPITVPPVKVPGTTLPTLGGLPGLPGGKSSGSNPGHSPGTGITYTPPGRSIPQEVVPSGNGNGPGTVNDAGFGNALPALGDAADAANGLNSDNGGANSSVNQSAAAHTLPKSRSVELSSKPSPSAQLPVLLAIAAIIALSLVTATYARLYLLRKPPSA